MIKGRFIGKEEEIALYPEGVPEQRGKKWVEDLFMDCSDGNGNYDYKKAYDMFVKKYPRIATGNPKSAWVKRLAVAQ